MAFHIELLTNQVPFAKNRDKLAGQSMADGLQYQFLHMLPRPIIV